MPEDTEDVDEDTEALLQADFQIGHFIRERIVPHAVLYFTGEAVEDVRVCYLLYPQSTTALVKYLNMRSCIG